VPDDDRILADQNLLDQEANDALALLHIERVRGRTQPGKEGGKRFGETQISSSFGALVNQGLQFGVHGPLALPQFGHPGPELVQRDDVFLVGRQQPVHAITDPCEVTLESCFPAFGRAGGTSCCQPAIDLCSDQIGILQQLYDRIPHYTVEEILANGTVVTERGCQVPPRIRANATVVVNRARSRPGRCPIQRIPALAARYKALQDTGLDGAT
jgi:hypothetical protein